MRCRTCDYPLWNLPTRACPECGTPYRPSDYHFVPNSVRFCCQHCDQPYYGTTEHGHLIPRNFNCVTCGQRIEMDEMVLRPAEGVEEAQTLTDVMPWLQRTRIGWLKGWGKTVLMAMVAPRRLMKAVPLEAGAGEGWLFTLFTHLLIFGIGWSLPFLFFGLLTIGRTTPAMLAPAGWALLLGLVGTMVLIVLWGLVSHGLLMISGGCPHRIGRTYQAILYSSGANIVTAVPCVGLYFFWILWAWWVVSAILMVMQAQRARGLRATLCVGSLPFVVVAAIIISFFLLIFGMSRSVSSVSFAGPGTSYSPIMEAQALGNGILSHARQNNGEGPPHALQLVANGTLTAPDFAISQIGHDEANVPVANTTLDAFQYLPPNRMQMTAQDAGGALPRNVIAHRLGDVVLTYHGINLNKADPQLWIAIICADPAQQSVGNITSVAVLADGTISQLMLPIPVALQQQNAIRARNGLAPLPDPSTITNQQPATGP